MIINKVLASYTFRFMSLYVAGLSFVGLIVVFVLYLSYSYDYFLELHTSVNTEMSALKDVFAESNAEGVDEYIQAKIRLGELNQFSYMIADESYIKIAGNLDTWPTFKQYGDDWLSYQWDLVRWDRDNTQTAFFAKSIQLENGHHLLAARHFDVVIAVTSLINGVMMRSVIVSIFLGIIGGAFVAGLSVGRIDSMNKSVKRIMSGDLSERVDVATQSGDYRELATNLNLMLDRIQMLMQGLRQVADNIAHDLRTPLTRLRNNLDLLQQDDIQSTETVKSLINEADDLLSTFNALLRIARVESGNQRAGFAAVDLNVILLDVVEFYEPLALDKSIEITHSLNSAVVVNGDRDLLFQAFANIIDNAIKYTPSGGTIAVALQRHVEGATVSVADSGIGIADQDKTRVFQRFFRIEKSRSVHPGNGLGLSLVSAVVELHEGKVVLCDNEPGLKFDVFLAA